DAHRHHLDDPADPAGQLRPGLGAGADHRGPADGLRRGLPGSALQGQHPMINRDTPLLRAVRFGGLGIWLLITIFPLYWILVSSLKAPSDIAAYPVQYLPL